MSGKPRELYLDNAAEFKSEALRRDCDQHGIELRYRPPGQPHFGGIIERLIGTMMGMSTSCRAPRSPTPPQRGSYDSDSKAALTVRELQRWLALAVACYHSQVHEGLGAPRPECWADRVAAGPAVTVTGEAAFLVDFLPVIRRTLSRSGFVIDHVQYYSDALKPWIARRDRLGRFVLRRDPRDISRIWALDPDGSAYLEVPYRTLSRPPITSGSTRRPLPGCASWAAPRSTRTPCSRWWSRCARSPTPPRPPPARPAATGTAPYHTGAAAAGSDRARPQCRRHRRCGRDQPFEVIEQW